jgi:hypothetical protein
MGVTKFSTFEEAEQALWNFHPANCYFGEVRRLFEMKECLSPTAPEPGIKKYRSIRERDDLKH